jgi:glycosyltransferase involved in cell wall biosynthesis
VNILVWHVHGAWTTAFVHGPHRYLIPTLPDRGPDGRGRAETYEWPPAAVEVTPQQAAEEDVDVVVLQRPEELDGMAARWLGGREPGRDVRVVYVEHNAPQGRIAEMRHPTADRDDLTLVHVTHFNSLFWDGGRTPTRVVEHGIPDPGNRYTGEVPRSAVVINEAQRRWRVTGTDLLPRLSCALPADLFGMGAGHVAANGDVRTIDDLPQRHLHQEMARRRVYLHPVRWTSLGLSLIEAMMLGMPVVALATTEVGDAVPGDAGIVSNRLDRLEQALRRLGSDPGEAHAMGSAAREAALRRFGLDRFLRDWKDVLEEVVA